jgi:hypothetical protein
MVYYNIVEKIVHRTLQITFLPYAYIRNILVYVGNLNWTQRKNVCDKLPSDHFTRNLLAIINQKNSIKNID